MPSRRAKHAVWPKLALYCQDSAADRIQGRNDSRHGCDRAAGVTLGLPCVGLFKLRPPEAPPPPPEAEYIVWSLPQLGQCHQVQDDRSIHIKTAVRGGGGGDSSVPLPCVGLHDSSAGHPLLPGLSVPSASPWPMGSSCPGLPALPH